LPSQVQFPQRRSLSDVQSVNYSNGVKTSYYGQDYVSKFETTIYKCDDPNCDTCSFDQDSQSGKTCSQCYQNYLLNDDDGKCYSVQGIKPDAFGSSKVAFMAMSTLLLAISSF